MYYEDLSPYRYELPPGRHLASVRNVGWLEKGREHPSGASPGLAEALKRWAAGAMANPMRGFQVCGFCRPPLAGLMTATWEGETLWLGSAEIWMPDGEGGIFASPSLIVHYVEAHHYLPPPEFVAAAMRPIPDDWDAEGTAERLIESAFLPEP